MRLFTILGVIFLVVGIGLAIVAFLPGDGSTMDAVRVEGMGIAALTFIPMGIVFTAIGVYFGRMTAGRKRLLREGIPAQATILSLEGGSMVINNINYMISFRLRVMVPGRAPYDMDHRQLVPIFALASLPIGATVPVMVDPKDPQKLTIDLAGEAAGLRQAAATSAPAQVVPNTLSTMRDSAPNTFSPDLPPGAQAWPVVPGWSAPPASPTGQAADATLLAGGRPGTAFIREARDSGIDVHGDSVVELTLDVTPEGGSPYEVRTATLVPAAAASRALPGATVAVRIDQALPDRVAFDWQG